MLPAQPNQSLMNGLACLQAVVTADGPVGSREVARQLGLEHTRVSRLLGTLCHLGFVERTERRKFRPGAGIHVLSAQSLRGSGLLAAALPHMRALADEALTLALGVLWDRSISYLVHARPAQPPDDAIGAHRLYPAEESILGVALMAHVTDAEVRRRFSRPPRALAREAIAGFLEKVRRARAEGVAIEETAPGTWSLAAVVGEPPVAAIAWAGARDKARLPALGVRLKAAAAKIAADLCG